MHPRSQSIHPTPGPDIYASARACIHVDLQRPRWQDVARGSLCRGVDRARAAAAVGPLTAACMAAVWSSWLAGAVQYAAATQGARRGAAGEYNRVMHGHRAGIEPSLRACASSNISRFKHGIHIEPSWPAC